MISYIAVSILFTPCIMLSLNMITCEKKTEKWFFDPMLNRCDAAYMLASTMSCLVFIFITIFLIGLPPTY